VGEKKKKAFIGRNAKNYIENQNNMPLHEGPCRSMSDIEPKFTLGGGKATDGNGGNHEMARGKAGRREKTTLKVQRLVFVGWRKRSPRTVRDVHIPKQGKAI